MAITNVTTTSDNGVQRVTNNQDVASARIDGETIILDNSTSRLRAISADGLIVTDSQVKLDSDINNGFNEDCAITYGDRSASNQMAFRDSSILIAQQSGRKNILVSELSQSTVVESQQSRQTYCYTQRDAILNDVVFDGINVWEVYATPSIASNIIVRNTNYGYLNWQAGRLDFLYFAVENINIAHAWMGFGNLNRVYHWNNDTSFDNTKVRHQSPSGIYYEGYTATWQFKDRDSGADVEDVLLVYTDDLGGSDAEVGRYLSNSNGLLEGTVSTQDRSTVTSQELPSLFVLTLKSDTSGSTYSSPGGGSSYDLDTITPKIEIRTYGHEIATGFVAGDTFSITEGIGTLNADYSVNTPQAFNLVPDSILTETDKNIVDAYTELDTAAKFYDRSKAEWRDNDGYPIITRVLNEIDFGSYDLDIITTASDAYSFSGNKITANATIFAGDINTTGVVDVAAIVDGHTIKNSQDVTLTTLPATLTLDNAILNLPPGADVTAYTEVNGGSYKATADGTYTARGKNVSIIDPNGFTITVVNTLGASVLPDYSGSSTYSVYPTEADAIAETNAVQSAIAKGTSYTYNVGTGNIYLRRDDVLAVFAYDISTLGDDNPLAMFFGDEVQIAQAPELDKIQPILGLTTLINHNNPSIC